MNWKSLFSLVLLLSSLAFDISKGNDFTNCRNYVYIREDSAKYDKTTAFLSDTTKRPLGFMYAVIPFETSNVNAKNPCFTLSLSNGTSQTVQVLATSAVGDSTICVKSEPDYAQPTCQSGIQTCQDSAVEHSTIKYVFYCDGCEAPIPIWFRLSVSPVFTKGLDFETWCSEFNSDYPNSLIVLPNAPDPTTKTTSEGSRTRVTFVWISSLGLAFLLVHLLN